MVNYKYDCMDAYMHNVKKHPQQDLKDRGLQYVKAEAFSILDAWVFRFEEEIKDPPPYMRRISDDFRFSDEEE